MGKKPRRKQRREKTNLTLDDAISALPKLRRRKVVSRAKAWKRERELFEQEQRAKAGLPALSTDIPPELQAALDQRGLKAALDVMKQNFTGPVVLKAEAVTKPMDAMHDVQALTTVLNALTSQQSDRAKARIMNFVKDFFDENHGH